MKEAHLRRQLQAKMAMTSVGSAPVVVPDVEMSSHEMRDDQEAGAAEGFKFSATSSR